VEIDTHATGPLSVLPVVAQVGYSPYDYIVTPEGLADLLVEIGEARARSILRNATCDPDRAPRGVYTKTSFAIAVVNRIIWPWTTQDKYILGTIAIGPDGERLRPNAICKAMNAWRLGGNYGDAVNANPLLCGDGNFRWGHSGVGTFPYGGSGLDANQDQYEAAAAERDLAKRLLALHEEWVWTRGKGSWFTHNNRPDPRWLNMAAMVSGPVARVGAGHNGT
jgi:hypothetical protein